MRYDDFRQVFQWFTVTYVHDDFVVSYKTREQVNSKEVFKFRVRQGGEAFVGVDVYQKRQYPDQCDGSVRGRVYLL